MAKVKKQPPTIDYDALFKEFITEFFPDFVAFANPELFEAIDWTQEHEFLEQEFINSLKGKFKLKGKRRHADKLVKVYLKTGEVHFLLVHIEIQHEPEADFPIRMLWYRLFIQMKYSIDEVSAYAIFTGEPPSDKALSYQKETFGTNLVYNYPNLIAATMDEEILIAAKSNPFALAMLAAK
jgi:hypothetical protein